MAKKPPPKDDLKGIISKAMNPRAKPKYRMPPAKAAARKSKLDAASRKAGIWEYPKPRKPKP